jgi:hypothetical protein
VVTKRAPKPISSYNHFREWRERCTDTPIYFAERRVDYKHRRRYKSQLW